ncbi:UNVERIFIED_CONTAM: hypothetical protein Scaly_2520300 [Sesamum calycinum]|uniref:RNase H type-1 domain-containing protein n=1 Tax=Sesamum calycinum TaxID=2727403 RepID=A0AAW2LUU3_9LAMI
MVQYLQQIEELNTKFKSFQLQQIPREENVKADSLSKLASTLEDCKTRRITVQYLPEQQAQLNIQAILLSDNGRNVIQEVLHTPLAPLPIPRRRLARAQRNTRQMLWIRHQDLDTGQQSTMSWLLLAHYEIGCTMEMDIVGSFSLATGQRKFLLVAINYFTKWVEAEHLARITEGVVMKFIWKKSYVALDCPEK